MNEKNREMTPEAQQPEGGALGDAEQEFAALKAELAALRSSSSRGWKINAIFFVVLIAVIATYLYFLIYKPLSEVLEPSTLVQMAFSRVDDALMAQGAPKMDSGQLPDWAVKQLNARVPELVQQNLKPRLQDIQAKFPEYREKWTREISGQVPQLLDGGMTRLQQDLLPWAREQLLVWLDTKLDELLAKADETIDQAVAQVIDTHEESIKLLGKENVPRLRKALADAFEQQMGELLDPMFGGLDKKIADLTRQMQELVDRMDSGQLDQSDMLTIRLIQLTRALFTSFREKGIPGEPQGGVLQQLQQSLEKLGLGKPLSVGVTRQVQAAGPFLNVEDLDLSNVPEDQRDKVRAEIEKTLQQARAQTRGGPGAGRTPPGDREARAKAEAMRKGAEARRRAEQAHAGEAAAQ